MTIRQVFIEGAVAERAEAFVNDADYFDSLDRMATEALLLHVAELEREQERQRRREEREPRSNAIVKVQTTEGLKTMSVAEVADYEIEKGIVQLDTPKGEHDA